MPQCCLFVQLFPTTGRIFQYSLPYLSIDGTFHTGPYLAKALFLLDLPPMSAAAVGILSSLGVILLINSQDSEFDTHQGLCAFFPAGVGPGYLFGNLCAL